MSDQQFVLRWHYHQTTLIHNLPCFLDSDILTDVTLSVGAEKVKAHKVILAMCSVYFLQLFQEIKTAHPVVVLHNVSFDDVNAILSFMYRGQCVVSQERISSLLSVARLLKIQGLCDMKVPDKLIRNDISTHDNEQFREKIINEKRFETYNYNYEELRQHLNEDINLKRQNDRISVENVIWESPLNTILDRKDTPVIQETIPAKSEDQRYPIFPKRFTTKDSSETCKCFLCGKYLSNQYNLRVHMETHEEAYHACQSCPHVSRSRDALRKHVSYRHPEQYQNRKRKKTDNIN